MNILPMLDKIEQVVRNITPSVGQVHSQLLQGFEPDEAKLDIEFTDPVAGKIVKVWVVWPVEATEQPLTVGRGQMFVQQDFRITGFISVIKGKATDRIITQDEERIRKALRSLTCLENGSNARYTGRAVTSALDRIKLIGILCHTKNVVITVDDKPEV